MGCTSTKSIESTNRSNFDQSASMSYYDFMKKYPHLKPDDQFDPRLSLSMKQVFRLLKTWRGIQKNIQVAGIEMFIGLFRRRTDLKGLFQGFSDIDNEDELRENNALEAHATLVMGVFDEAIQNIDKVDYVFQLLEKVGRSHQRFPGFTGDLFWNMDKPFMHSVKLTLGDRYSEAIETIYHKTITFLLTNLERAFNNEKLENI